MRSKAAGNVCVVWPGWTRRRTGKVVREVEQRDPATREDILHQGELKALAERETAKRKGAEAHAKREAERAEREAERVQREAAERLVAQARVAELEAALQRALRRS